MCLAVPMKLLSVDATAGQGKVALGAAALDVDLSLLEDAQPGEYVLVHAGVAIERMDEEAARQTIALLAELEASDDRPGAA